MRTLGIVAAAVVIVGCGSSAQLVPLLAAAGVPVTQPTTVPLRIVTRSTAIKDPLPLRGTSVVYGDVEAALGHAIASATVPWAEARRSAESRRGGWELFVEVTNADAERDGERVVFSVGVRATLRARIGNVYLAQTQASCRQGGIVQPDAGAPIMYRCMTEIGRDLDGWLEGVDLQAVGTR